ncbi:MAG: tRNA (adenosine(37)-N6)-threonylcarbamoyltransferase complex dimerization subunit type 1 TsaB [Gammaproteobacteria bacterium]|nr:tRNA (adenosine(37)-N6)-threonylcarbamoyltransferase complex dimerization subunit type 1 TsaB [Gammaproteobacteria bacterium]
MKLLAIETAAEACSAALYLDGEIALRQVVEPRRHSALILEMMDALLAEAQLGLSQLDGLAFGCGPGSFTGVRIATGVIQGVAFAEDLPVVPVSTLAALAQRCFRERGERRLLPAFDARMGELYWGSYRIDDSGLAAPVERELVADPQRVFLPDGGEWFGVGSGWIAHGTVLRDRFAARLSGVDGATLCSAWDVALLGEAGFRAGKAVTAEQALPVYLRDRVAWKPRTDPSV